MGQQAASGEVGPRVASKRLRWAVWAIGVDGLLVLGAGLGQLFWPAQLTEQVVVAPTAEASQAAGSSAQFPHVIGLDETTARSAIASAGFADPTVTIIHEPAAGPERYVVAQDPEPGSVQALTSLRVTLTLSTSVSMPNVVGKSVDDAKKAITDLYGIPQLVKVTTAEAPSGVVLSTEPAAGSAMTVEVIVRVSDGGQSVSLLELTSVASSRCAKGTNLVIDGENQTQGLVCYPGVSDRPSYVEYAVGRHATYLDATLGMLDEGGQSDARVKVIGDGKVLSTSQIRFGTKTTLHVSVRGVLRLRIEVTGPSVSGTSPRLVLGDVRLVGNPDDLDQIGG